ncbi:MAG: hypothetical protein U9N55_06685 [candidate division Zixibacteria bacterium]|nr:hypothetical protein [candidate division Zixibacteria bacterium]
MELLLTDILGNGWYLMLTGLLGMALFFAMSGFRDLKSQHYESLLFLVLSVFFFLSHLYLLYDISVQSSFGSLAIEFTL